MLKGQQNTVKSKELKEAMAEIKKIRIQGNHLTAEMTHADLIQLGGYAAVEYCGGPQMVFRMGRLDIQGEPNVVKHEAESVYNSYNVSQLSKLNLAPEDYVALIGGCHTLGFHGLDKKGAQCRWTQNPYIFDHSYFKEAMMRDKSRYFKSDADHKMMQNSETKAWVEKYADDNDLFFANFAKAHVALSELNCFDLMGEMNEEERIDGGY